MRIWGYDEHLMIYDDIWCHWWLYTIHDDTWGSTITCSSFPRHRPCAAKLPSKWTANSAALVQLSTWNPGMAQDARAIRSVGIKIHNCCPTKLESQLECFGWFCVILDDLPIFSLPDQVQNSAGYELGAKFLPVDKDALAQKAMVLLPAGKILCLTG